MGSIQIWSTSSFDTRHESVRGIAENALRKLGTSEAQFADWKKKADQLSIDQLSIDTEFKYAVNDAQALKDYLKDYVGIPDE